MDYYTLLDSHGIPKKQVRRFSFISENNETLIFAEIIPSQRICPFCSSNETVVKEYKTKTIKALTTGKDKTFIEYKLPRYKCKLCNKTYTHNFSDQIEKSLSKQVISKIIDDFSEMLTFSQIADKYNITTTQAIELFDRYCPDMRNPIEEAICIDEFSNTRKSHNKYSCILVGFTSHKIIDIIKNRTLPYLRQYFDKQPLSLRDKVRYIITDMYDGYITIANEFFKNATIAIDPFHYMEYLTEAVQNIRRDLIDSNKYLLDRTWMNKHWRMLTMSLDDLPKENMVLPTGESISYSDRIHRFIKQDRELDYAYWLLQNFYVASKRLTYERAISYIDMTIKNMLNSTSRHLQACGKTWLNYQEYITNSFIKFNGVRLSNGPVEGINARVKTLKKIYCGFRNIIRFYKRIILIINKRAK